MFESRGRKNLEVYVEGELYMVKKPQKLNNSVAVLLPKDWIEAVSVGREITYFLLDIRDTQIILKPYYEKELPMGAGQ